MTALLRKIALKKVEAIAFIVQTINLSCGRFVVFSLFLSVLLLLLLSTHYMWFIEGQDLATEAIESSLLSDG